MKNETQGRTPMKKLTTIAFAALIAVTLSMPAWSQTQPAPAAQKDAKKADSKTAPESKKAAKKANKKAAKAAAKKDNKDEKKDAAKK
jgi:hypothetical protein